MSVYDAMRKNRERNLQEKFTVLFRPGKEWIEEEKVLIVNKLPGVVITREEFPFHLLIQGYHLSEEILLQVLSDNPRIFVNHTRGLNDHRLPFVPGK